MLGEIKNNMLKVGVAKWIGSARPICLTRHFLHNGLRSSIQYFKVANARFLRKIKGSNFYQEREEKKKKPTSKTHPA
jgi:hypothetical protein